MFAETLSTALLGADPIGTAFVFSTRGGAGAPTYLIQTDWLGTERARVLPSGDLFETCSSLPFGDGQVCKGSADPSPNHLTGKERDLETGLDYFGARFYGSVFGRFLSTDHAPFKWANPQSLNRYTFVINNPLRLVDPDGNAPIDAYLIDRATHFNRYAQSLVPKTARIVTSFLSSGNANNLSEASRSILTRAWSDYQSAGDGPGGSMARDSLQANIVKQAATDLSYQIGGERILSAFKTYSNAATTTRGEDSDAFRAVQNSLDKEKNSTTNKVSDAMNAIVTWIPPVKGAEVVWEVVDKGAMQSIISRPRRLGCWKTSK